MRRAIPATVWLCTIGIVIWLDTSAPGAIVLPGIVDAEQSHVTCPAAGHVAAVLVTLHQEVEQGQIVLRLDDADVRLRLARATCELERLRAELSRDEVELAQQARTAAAAHGLDAGVERRRLVSAVEAATLGMLATRTQLEEARVRVQGAAIENDRVAALAAAGVVGEPEVVRIRTECLAQQKRISELEALHRQHVARVETANARLREFDPSDPGAVCAETALAPMRWRLEVQESVLQRIAEDGKQLLLQAPSRGRVARIGVVVGEWTTAGRSLVAIIDSTPRRILAYLPDGTRHHVDNGQSVRVSRPDNSLLGTTTIQSISPAVVRVPPRLWLDPQREQWAFEVVVAPTGLERPGERVQLVWHP